MVMTTLSINPKETWALLIGVENFTYEGLPAIPAVPCNLVGLRQLLENPAIVGIPYKQIVVIENPKDSTHILTKMANLPQMVETLLVYYAGHGIPYNGTDKICADRLYLAHVNTPHDKSSMALPFVDLWDETIDRASNLIYILDCCLSGNALKTVKPIPNKKVSVLTATLYNKNARTPKGERYTAFTKHLIELLENGFGNEPTLTTKELREELSKRCSPSENIPKPWGLDYFDEPLRIAHNRSYSQTGRGTLLAEKQIQKTIFLAEVTNDLIDSLDSVRNFLNQRKDIRVLSAQDYGVCSEKRTEDLQQSDLFVQLLSDQPGEKDLVSTQLESAKGRLILQWRSPMLKLAEVQNEAHRQLLKGVTVKAMELADFQDEILKQLFPPQNQTAPKLTAGALVMVNPATEDTELLDEITSCLDDRNISYTSAMKPSGQISTKVGSRGLQEHRLTCNYHFRVRTPNFTSEEVTLNWVLLSYPTTTP
jgi:hypothetical protein